MFYSVSLWQITMHIRNFGRKRIILLFFLSEGKELKDDVISRETSSLTRAQAAAVKKRVDTLNATLRKKQKLKDKQKADVRDLFTPSQVSVKAFLQSK